MAEKPSCGFYASSIIGLLLLVPSSMIAATSVSSWMSSFIGLNRGLFVSVDMLFYSGIMGIIGSFITMYAQYLYYKALIEGKPVDKGVIRAGSTVSIAGLAVIAIGEIIYSSITTKTAPQTYMGPKLDPIVFASLLIVLGITMLIIGSLLYNSILYLTLRNKYGFTATLPLLFSSIAAIYLLSAPIPILSLIPMYITGYTFLTSSRNKLA